MPAPQPRMHGLTHVPGGSDPIPGLPAAAVSFPETILGIASTLLGYWRLGETASPFADISGHPSGPVNAILVAGATAMTLDIPGALPAGDDDGAVQFNSLTDGDYLTAGDPRFNLSNEPMTVAAWIRPAAGTDPHPATAVGGWFTTALECGWRIGLNYPALTPFFQRRNLSSADAVCTGPALTAGRWAFVVGTYDPVDGHRLYINAEPASANPAVFGSLPSTNQGPKFGLGAKPGAAFNFFLGALDEVSIWEAALTPAEIRALYDAGIGGDAGGVDVTVNGSHMAAASAPQPPPPPLPTDPDDVFPGITDWIVDQPFVYGGATFTVQPHTWTTIPFTTPLMERWSNIAGTTHYVELDDDDPDSAGWISDTSEYTSKAIVVPHDMPFLPVDEYDWMQVCLKLESPAVEDTTSSRALRIFETTRQKTLVQEYRPRPLAGGDGGAMHVFRELGKPGTDTDSVFAARGPDLTAGPVPDNIMFMPLSGGGFTMNGNDWLPRNTTGHPILKAGMRLVAQVWHDASVALTFDCANPYPYRPHLAVAQTCQRAWGSPWSDWPT